jgi:hypothetical protein
MNPSHAFRGPSTPSSRFALWAALAVVLGLLLLPGTVSGKVRHGYHYAGTTSQHGLTFNLFLTPTGSTGWTLDAKYKADFSPSRCGNAFLFASSTHLIAKNVHIHTVIPNVRTKLVVKNGKGQNNRFIKGHTVKNFTAIFTKGKVTGSFSNDSFRFHSTRCSTGRVTFSASRLAF